MKQETTKVVLWRISSTEKAYLFSTTPTPVTGGEGRRIWLPRSQISHLSGDPHKPTEWQRCTITIPLWLAEKNDL